MRLLVTRPREDAERFSRQLVAAGHTAVISSVIRIEATGAVFPGGHFGGVVASSAHAFEFAGPNLDALADAPVYAVGARTVEAARAKGMRNIATQARDAAELAQAVPLPGGTRLLYLAGVDRKPALEMALQAAGIELTVVEVYRACAADTLSAVVVEQLGAGRIDGVCHFSRRSAELFAALAARAGLLEAARKAEHFCLSEDVAQGLALLEPVQTLWPDAPETSRLLLLIGNGRQG